MPPARRPGGSDQRRHFRLARGDPPEHGETGVEDNCSRGSGLNASMGPVFGHARGEGAQWRFVPPPNTSIGGFRIEWSGAAANFGEATISRSDQPDPTYVARHHDESFNEVQEQTGLDFQYLSVIVACSFNTTCSAGQVPATYSMPRVRMALNDTSAPQASNVGGPLVDAPVLRGAPKVSLTGQDSGGGVYRVLLAADGRDVAASPLPDTSGRCHDPAANADPYEFEWPQPCPLSVRAEASIDTRGLPNGVHAVSGYLEDAAGNRTTLFGPVLKTIDNSAATTVDRGALNGTNGGEDALLTRRGRGRRTTSFGGRRIVLRGSLRRGGQPVAGALLDVLALNDVPGGRVHKIGEAHTTARGNYSIRVRPGPSRLLRVAYRAYANDAAPVATVDVRQRVHAGVGLDVLRARVPAGGAARFRGLVHGGFIPRHGKLVELQAFDGGAWRTFVTVRTTRSGRFKARHRFTRTPPGRTFRFRARVRAERGYPFLLGVSRQVRLRVG